MKYNPLIVLVAGGTGGHVFPAISLMESLSTEKYFFKFLTDKRCEYIFKMHDIDYKTFQSSALPKKLFSFPKAIFRIVSGIIFCFKFFKKYRPSIVIGFGGYVSIPAIISARILRIPTIIHEQNSVMGKANKFLSIISNYIALSYGNIKSLRKKKNIHVTGIPIRKEFYESLKKFSSKKKRILIVGGSQGAGYFSKLIPTMIENLKNEELKKIIIIQQVIPNDMERLKRLYTKKQISFKVDIFFPKIIEEIYNADLIISRCGASTLEEISVFSKPSILFPLPDSKDNHQFFNALEFKKKNKSFIFDENNFEINHFLKIIKSVIIETKTHKISKKKKNINFKTLIENILKR